MSNYGRYFEFRTSPIPEHRVGRGMSPAVVIPIGAPVKATTGANAIDANGRSVYELATGATTPAPHRNGIAIFEHSYNAYAGFDTVLVSPSDFSDIPASSAIQVVHGPEVKVVFRNIATDTAFLGRTYDDSRTFIAPTNLSTLAVNDFIIPGTGDGTSGYWAEGGNEATAWFIVTLVDTARGEVEAQMLF